MRSLAVEATVTAVGLRDLKNHLSEHFDRVKAGETIVVTERGREIARIVPAGESRSNEFLWTLVREGAVEWGGGKPGEWPGIPIKGAPLSDTVELERQERDDAISGHERPGEALRYRGRKRASKA